MRVTGIRTDPPSKLLVGSAPRERGAYYCSDSVDAGLVTSFGVLISARRQAVDTSPGQTLTVSARPRTS